MSQPFTKYHPDPSKPITRSHARQLVQWGLWAKAKARGVRVRAEEALDEAASETGPESEGNPQSVAGSAVTEPPADETDEGGEDFSYDVYTVEELRAELTERKLAKGGTKDELIARLEKDDEKANA